MSRPLGATLRDNFFGLSGCKWTLTQKISTDLLSLNYFLGLAIAGVGGVASSKPVATAGM